MSKLTVSLEIPRDILGVLDIPENQITAQILELIALELFRQGRISTGKGAELLSISKYEFIQKLATHKISYFTESPDELNAQIVAIENME